MTKDVQCPNCNMVFSESIRLERHMKKAHPAKQKIEPNPSSDFNHAYLPYSSFL